VWPAIFLAIGVIVAALRARGAEENLPEDGEDPGRRLRSRRSAPAWGALIAVVALAPTVVLWGPILVQLFTALGMSMAWACSVLVVVAVGLVIGAFTPLATAGGGRGGRSGATRSDPA
jgi:hypothetical protein